MGRIYVSSTYLDLVEHREAARRAIERRGHRPAGMELYGATDERPLEYCTRDVDACQGYVGILARRYGYVPPGQPKSITHLEYEAATARGLKRFIFALDPKASWKQEHTQPDRRLDAFRAQLERDHIVKRFHTLDQLEYEVYVAIDDHFGRGRPVPPLLPYLCDRSDQELALQALLEDARAVRGARPVLAVVHGDEHQSHDQFLARLVHRTLPNVLGLGETQPIAQYQADVTLKGDFTATYAAALANKVLPGRESRGGAVERLSALALHFSAHPGPVVVNTHLLTEDADKRGPGIVRALAEHWAGWPSLRSGNLLIVLVFLKYQQPPPRGLFSFKPSRLRRLNDALESELDSQRLFAGLDVVGTVLPRLESVTRSEAESWARSHEAVRFLQGADAIPVIREIFERWRADQGSASIPMERLATALADALARLSAAREIPT